MHPLIYATTKQVIDQWLYDKGITTLTYLEIECYPEGYAITNSVHFSFTYLDKSYEYEYLPRHFAWLAELHEHLDCNSIVWSK